jgi:spermidine synthase
VAVSRALRLALLAALFFVSGAAGLVDQVVWLRHLGLVFGNTTLATATLLAVFLGGLGGGAWLLGRIASRLRRPLLAYGVVELGVALWAYASPTLFGWIDGAYVAVYRGAGVQPELFSLLRVALAALALVPPTMLMGASLPLLLSAAERAAGGRGGERLTALLYGVNTLGAVAGVAFAGFYSIRTVGLWATLLLASTAQAAVALVAVVMGCRAPVAEPAPAAGRPTELPGRPSPAARGLLLAAFAMGATSLAAEVLWTRILVFYFGSSVYAYSLMLVLFLLGIGLGSTLLAPRLARRPPLAALAWLEAALALLAVVSVALFLSLDERLTVASELVRPREFGAGVLVQLLAALPIVLPPTLVMGATFPLVVAAAWAGRGDLGASAGRVYGANTAGSIVGALGAGFVLVPLAGSQNGLLLLGAFNGVLAVGFAAMAARAAGRTPGRSLGRWAPVALVPLAAMPLYPQAGVILSAGIFRGDRPGDLVAFEEDAQAAVAVRRKREAAGEYLSLELNGVNVAGTSRDLYAVQLMQGHLPLLLGAPGIERVVHVGFGSGGTAHAVAQHPVREIRIVEISPAVLAASDRWFAEINHGVLRDPRVKVELNDGRNFLLATPERFDAVLSDSIHPRYAGNGALYTREYFAQLAERLAPGGVASMWLPTYALTTRNFAQIVRAFRDVFPETIVWYEASVPNAFTIVTGRRAGETWDAAAVTAAMREPQVAAALATLGIRGPADLVACYLVGPPELDRLLSGVPPHVDDLPAVEYESGTLFERDRTWWQTFRALLAARPAEPPAALLAGLEPAERERAAEVWRRRGELLHAHLAWLDGRFAGAVAGR